MNKLKAFATAIILCFCTATFLSAKEPLRPEEKDYDVLLTAQEMLDSMDYGGALKMAMHAKNIRTQLCAWQLFILEKELSPAAVRSKGDYLPDVLQILKERNSFDAVQIISSLIEKKTDVFFDYSMKKLVSYISEKKAYPEADFICGKVYQFEGEYEMAMQFYDAAVQNADFLDIPAEKYEILYQMAYLAQQKNDNAEYEKYLLMILADDSLYYKNTVFCNAVMRTISSPAEKEPLKKFFSLYRVDSSNYLRAYNLISKYYLEYGETQKAVTAMALSVLSAFSKIYNVVHIREPYGNYSDFEELFIKMQDWEDITQWLQNNAVWETFISFAELTENLGYRTFSEQLFIAVYNSCPEKYWKQKIELHFHNRPLNNFRVSDN